MRCTFTSNDVAEVERLEICISGFAHRAFLDEILHCPRIVADGRKSESAHDSLEHHTACTSDLRRERCKLFSGLVAVLFVKVTEQILADKVIRIGDAVFAKLKELGAAFRNNRIFILYFCDRDVLVSHVAT